MSQHGYTYSDARRWLLADRGTAPERPLSILGTAHIDAAYSGDDAKRLRKFRMEAYNGGTMRFWWSADPIVVDLAGMDITAKSRPVLKDHSTSQVVGHSESARVVAADNGYRRLVLDGVASGTGPAAREVIANADNGFPWQASIGAEILGEIERVRAGVTVTINGRTFTGPLGIVRSSRLGEVSFVALGADDSTEVRMTAGRNASTNRPGETMDFETWLKAKGFTLAELNDTQKASLQAAFASEGKATATAEAEPEQDTAADLKASRKQAADESRRIAGIRKVCANKHPDIEAKAIEDGMSVDSAELLVLRASRATAPAIHAGAAAGINSEVLECAILQASRPTASMVADDADGGAGTRSRHERMLASYGEKVQATAHKAFRNGISLNQMIIEAARANGYTGRALKVDREVLKAAFALEAGFSAVDITGILANVANKTLLDGFMSVEQAWRQVSSVAAVNDFKEIKRYRLNGDETYEEVGPGGKIKHGSLSEIEYGNRAKTFAKMLSITRQDIKNDDLGALTTVPRRLGRGAATKLNRVFWTEFLADLSTFYTTGRGNYFEGASASLLTIDGLTEAERLFGVQTDGATPVANPLGLTPRRLLVPMALKAKGWALMNSTEIRDTTASTKAPIGNPFAGRFDLVWSAYLSDSNITGNSAKAWYLLADPQDLAVIETVFLDGQESPTVETAEADFNELGIQMRGYHDFGVRKQEYRAAVRSKGEG